MRGKKRPALFMNGKKPIRVLHVVHWPVSGITFLFKNVISLMPADVESHIVFFQFDENTSQEFKKICASVHSLDFLLSPVNSALAYKRIIRDIAPDILHTHSFLPMALGTVLTLGRKNQVNSIHSDYPYFALSNIKSLVKRKAQKSLINWTGIKAVAVSKRVSRALASIGVAGENILLIENGVITSGKAVSAKAVEKARSEFRSKKGDIHIITLGRMDKLKGYDYLLKAFKQLNQRHSNTILIFVGEGQEMERLKALAGELGIEGRVRFMGFKKDPRPYLSAADFYVCSSVTEGFSLAVAEAMLSKLPIVATGVGSNQDIIEDGVSGYIVEPRSPDALASALEKMIASSESKTMGIRGHDMILQNFDIKKTAGMYENLYRGLNKS